MAEIRRVSPDYKHIFTQSIRAVMILTTMIIMVVGVFEYYIESGGYILFGVKVADWNVGGLSKDAALIRLELNFKEKYQTKIALQIDEATYSFSPWELGYRADFAKAVEAAYDWGRTGGIFQRWQERHQGTPIALNEYWDHVEQAKTLKPLANLYRKLPVPAYAYFIGDQVVYSQSIDGSYLDVWEISQEIAEISDLALEELEISGKLQPIVAFPSTDDLVAWGLDQSIAGYTTYYNSDNNRGANIELAAKILNGTLIYPGEEFSFNRVLGERTDVKGYKTAPVIVEGKYQDQTGGGICQVASTLYSAILTANAQGEAFQLLERHTHSLPVDYVPEDYDATVSYGYKDFRFTHYNPKPILLQVTAENGKLSILFRGLSVK